MKEIKNDLNSVKDDLNSMTNDLGSLNKSVSNLSGDIEDYKQQTGSELAKQTSELNKMSENINMLRNDTNSLKEDLSSLNDSMNRISDNVEGHDNHVTTELMELDQNLQQNFILQLKNSYVYITPLYQCGGTGGWRRVVYLDMTNPNTTCPSGWKLNNDPKRTCGRVSTSAFTCDSVTFPVCGGDYTRVCGRIVAYQDEGTGAFEPYDDGVVITIEGSYATGVSLTHGSPRQHIWTFAAGHSEYENTNYVCPCDTTIDISIPPFVGGDYFCESGRNSHEINMFFPDDPLWDGDGCSANSTCCSFNNPPYFTKQLPNPTTDDIEARLCNDYTIEDTPIELIELYVQ